jgi:hypothetical protein
MSRFPAPSRVSLACAAAFILQTPLAARADVVTDWNLRAGEILAEAKLGTPPAVRAMAMVQTAVHEAALASKDVPVEAAIAAANRSMLLKLVPAQQALIESTYAAALAKVADTPAKVAAVAVGEKAAANVLARRSDDLAPGADEYRPHAGAGAYVPTVTPAAPTWARRKPWVLANAAEVRPGPPPALASATWARDFNEVKTFGSKGSAARTDEQTQVARFWEYSLPPIYYGVLRSVADRQGRDVLANARLYAAASQAMDDALISVFDAKYHYAFWRPQTAIRNGDADGNEATDRDASWAPLVDAPLHPEFPSAHATLAGAVGAVIKAEVGSGPMPVLATSSPTAKGAVRRWASADDFTREVGESRIYAGIHYRSAVEAGSAAGKRIGEMAAARHLQPVRVGEAK